MEERIYLNYDEKDRPVDVQFENNRLAVTLADGRIISVPLERYPRLASATSEQRTNYYLSHFGIHWDDIDERPQSAVNSPK